MPRPKTEASAYLNAYKLTTEKQRLQQELVSLTLRQQKIQAQLAFIDSQVAEIEKGLGQHRSQQSAAVLAHISVQALPPAKAMALSADVSSGSPQFETMLLEY